MQAEDSSGGATRSISDEGLSAKRKNYSRVSFRAKIYENNNSYSLLNGKKCNFLKHEERLNTNTKI